MYSCKLWRILNRKKLKSNWMNFRYFVGLILVEIGTAIIGAKVHFTRHMKSK